MKTTNYGQLNPHTIGMTLKEIMRRTMEETWSRRASFVAKEKVSVYKPDSRDCVTDADFASQEIFVRKLSECFPGYGIVAEEKDFLRQCSIPNENLFFSVDPLDGTKAFERRQSQGFGPMLSLCTNEEVISAFVGDAMTKELYYYRPGSDKAHRLNFGDHRCEELRIDEDDRLSDQYVLLRDNPDELPKTYRDIARPTTRGGVFKNIEIAGGGIGTGLARLWKGEVGAYVIKAGMQQPWDILPVWGISKKLGFVWLTQAGTDPTQQHWEQRGIIPSMEAVRFETPSVIINKSRISEFMAKAMP